MARLPLRYLLLSDVSRVSIFPFLFFFPFFHTFYSRSVFLVTSRSAIAAFKFLRSRYKKKEETGVKKRTGTKNTNRKYETSRRIDSTLERPCSLPEMTFERGPIFAWSSIFHSGLLSYTFPSVSRAQVFSFLFVSFRVAFCSMALKGVVLSMPPFAFATMGLFPFLHLIVSLNLPINFFLFSLKRKKWQLQTKKEQRDWKKDRWKSPSSCHDSVFCFSSLFFRHSFRSVCVAHSRNSCRAT